MINPIVESVKFEGFIEKREALIKEMMTFIVNSKQKKISEEEEDFLLSISKRKAIKRRYYLSKKQFSWLSTIAIRHSYGLKVKKENYEKLKYILRYGWFSKKIFAVIKTTIEEMEKELLINQN